MQTMPESEEAMSGFSDKHLKAAKIHAILMDDSSQKALLARLDAAEKLIEACGQDLNVSKQYEAWLLSKGGAGK